MQYLQLAICTDTDTLKFGRISDEEMKFSEISGTCICLGNIRICITVICRYTVVALVIHMTCRETCMMVNFNMTLTL